MDRGPGWRVSRLADIQDSSERRRVNYVLQRLPNKGVDEAYQALMVCQGDADQAVLYLSAGNANTQQHQQQNFGFGMQPWQFGTTPSFTYPFSYTHSYNNSAPWNNFATGGQQACHTDPTVNSYTSTYSSGAPIGSASPASEESNPDRPNPAPGTNSPFAVAGRSSETPYPSVPQPDPRPVCSKLEINDTPSACPTPLVKNNNNEIAGSETEQTERKRDLKLDARLMELKQKAKESMARRTAKKMETAQDSNVKIPTPTVQVAEADGDFLSDMEEGEIIEEASDTRKEKPGAPNDIDELIAEGKAAAEVSARSALHKVNSEQSTSQIPSSPGSDALQLCHDLSETIIEAQVEQKQIDKDVQDWLRITGYHNIEFREKTLKRQRRLAEIEEERDSLLQEANKEAASTEVLKVQTVKGPTSPKKPQRPMPLRFTSVLSKPAAAKDEKDMPKAEPPINTPKVSKTPSRPSAKRNPCRANKKRRVERSPPRSAPPARPSVMNRAPVKPAVDIQRDRLAREREIREQEQERRERGRREYDSYQPRADLFDGRRNRRDPLDYDRRRGSPGFGSRAYRRP